MTTITQPDSWLGVEFRHLAVLLESGELDLAFCGLPLPDGPFDTLQLMSDPYVLVVPADSDLASRTAATLTDLGEFSLIGSLACSHSGTLEASLQASGYTV